jgi:glycosyltransferase involved in cell wall biosynthesis
MAETSESSGGAGRPPRLAVLMPVYNGQRGLERSLESLRDDGAVFDVVVVDDGSEPPIRVPSGDDLRFTVTLIRLPQNRGITSALNAGLEHIKATGYEYVARLDAGDLSLPGRLTAQAAFLDRHSEHAVVGTRAEAVDLKGRFLFYLRPPTEHEDLVRIQQYKSGFVHPSVMMRIAALLESGFYCEKYPGGEDYELFLRLAKTHKIGNLDEVYLKYEVNPHSLTAHRFRRGLSRLRLLVQHFSPFSVHAYLGIVRSVILLFVPGPVTFRLRRVIARWSSIRKPMAAENEDG